MGGAISLGMATLGGIPVSTTHTISGAIIGVGSARRTRDVRWGIAFNLVIAWILTIPASGLIAAAFWWLGLHFLKNGGCHEHYPRYAQFHRTVTHHAENLGQRLHEIVENQRLNALFQPILDMSTAKWWAMKV
ncbi:phosphate transporter, putative [Ricinus communis]|uniref:Phosphate transporter, putative n=1 Tax=Ricinus communis TaxID=3988 RepID=B9TLN1_RICCO|nr:phosphate transporter, putative [Ricinus communis]